MANENNENVAKFQANAPEILIWEGQQEWEQPRHKVRYFHHRRVDGWSGYVKTTDVQGWVNNVRIDLFVQKWQRDHAGVLPTNDDILTWMIADPNKEFKLKELGESIVKNGVRQQIVIKADGTLLDGNRRYFASLFRLREAQKSGDTESENMVSHLPAFVLSPACTEADYDAVLVEENFVEDCREKWPSFIRAQRVYDKFNDLFLRGHSRTAAISSIVESFGTPKTQVERWIKMMNHIEEFHIFHSAQDEDLGKEAKDEYDIKWKSQKYFEYFDELTKTDVVRALDADPELREKTFERLFDDDFRNFKQIRSLPAISADVRAREKFMLLDGQKAVDDSIEWVSVVGLTKKALQVNDRILGFAKFLGSLTASDIERLDTQAVTALHEIASVVTEMADAVKGMRQETE